MKLDCFALVFLVACSGANVVDGQAAGGYVRNSSAKDATIDQDAKEGVQNGNSNPGDANAPSGNANPTKVNALPTNTLTSDSQESEATDRPVQVTGAYLHCVKLFAISTTVEVGCRFDDAKGKKIDPVTMASSVSYTAVLPTMDELVLETLRPTHKDRLYDALFRVTGPSLEIAHMAVDKTKVSVHLDKPVNLGTVTDFQTNVAQSLVLPNELNGNFSISSVSAPAGAGMSTPDAVIMVKDLISGLSYYRRLASRNTWIDTKNACENSTDGGFSDWRVPTRLSIEAAYAHGLEKNVTAMSNLRLKTETPIWTATEISGNMAFYFDANSSPPQFILNDKTYSLNAVLCER